MIVGTEWLIEAHGCDPESLRDETVLRAVFSRAMDELGLKAVGSVWHKFPGMGGVTGMVALTESHLACHTYPEHGTATFNLYCCRTRPEWEWEENLRTSLGAKSVNVIKIERGGESRISELRSQEAYLRFRLDAKHPSPAGEDESEISDLKFQIDSNYVDQTSRLKSEDIPEISDLKSEIDSIDSKDINFTSDHDAQFTNLRSEINTPAKATRFHLAGGDN